MKTVRSWAAAVICALTSITLVACTSARTTYLADGTRGYAVTCKGLLNSWDSCLVKAGRICGSRGYNAINEDQYDRTLFFGCKASAAVGK